MSGLPAGLIVGVSSGVRPIEAPSDHAFVVDHGELVVQLVAIPFPDWVLRDAHGIRAKSKPFSLMGQVDSP